MFFCLFSTFYIFLVFPPMYFRLRIFVFSYFNPVELYVSLFTPLGLHPSVSLSIRNVDLYRIFLYIPRLLVSLLTVYSNFRCLFLKIASEFRRRRFSRKEMISSSFPFHMQFHIKIEIIQVKMRDIYPVMFIGN